MMGDRVHGDLLGRICIEDHAFVRMKMWNWECFHAEVCRCDVRYEGGGKHSLVHK
jgi:hypothetical protein